jgi:glutathione synthase/RimK-type ligase-like ATP-grasp enzyme
MRPALVIGTPGDERVVAFESARARRGLPAARVLPWELFAAGAPLPLEARTLLRIESPGAHWPAERALLAAGADEPDERFDAPRLPRAAALALDEDRGRLRFMRQRFLGLRAMLRRLASALDARPDVQVMSAPASIAVMADKPRCHERLVGAGLPRPPVLGSPRDFEELEAVMNRHRVGRVFVKPASGGSAAGVIAFQSGGRGRRLAITATEQMDGRLYSVNRLRGHRDAAAVAVLDAICREGVLVERWIPKLGVAGATFDLRVLVIAGRARHVVVRTSPGPITNLHLGRANRRGDLAAVRAKMGEARFAAALRTCERAAACFADSLYVGVDVLVATDGRPFIVELNPFGDLLHRASSEGEDPHEAELGALERAPARAAGP